MIRFLSAPWSFIMTELPQGKRARLRPVDRFCLFFHLLFPSCIVSCVSPKNGPITVVDVGASQAIVSCGWAAAPVFFIAYWDSPNSVILSPNIRGSSQAVVSDE